VFSLDEVAILRAETERCAKLDREEISRGPQGEALFLWALEGYSDAFDTLLHDPRMVEPAKRLLGEDIYQHQLKVSCKPPGKGLDIPWHHDYDSWLRNDGMLEPGALNIAVYLDDVEADNGPLSFVPGSHRAGPDGQRLPTLHYDESGALFPVIEDEVLEPVIEKHGTLTPLAPAGSVVLFSDCIAHSSPPSESERTRHIVYLTINRISNALTHATRPWYMGNREPRRIDAGDRESLGRCRPGPPKRRA